MSKVKQQLANKQPVCPQTQPDTYTLLQQLLHALAGWDQLSDDDLFEEDIRARARAWVDFGRRLASDPDASRPVG